jgi:hypothetical protein
MLQRHYEQQLHCGGCNSRSSSTTSGKSSSKRLHRQQQQQQQLCRGATEKQQ